MYAIETTKLTKNYGKARGITDLDLRVEKGEFFGFIGPNGAGKSTTIRTLLGLIRPTSGEGRVLGRPLSQRREILAQVGYMASEAMFYPGMRAGEVIAYSARLRGKDCSASARSLCKALDLDTSKRVEELSLGNRKKLSIVCALQAEPALYILDEPTSGLDPLIQKTFFELLHARSREGATVFFSSHVLSEVQHHCTRAAIIRAGRLAAEDRVDQLQRTSARRVTLRGVREAPLGLEVRCVTPMEEGVSFLYQGEVGRLVSALQGLPLTDLTITEPELEEVFLHYYEKEGAQ